VETGRSRSKVGWAKLACEALSSVLSRERRKGEKELGREGGRERGRAESLVY
jgi:hypothetical protein